MVTVICSTCNWGSIMGRGGVTTFDGLVTAVGDNSSVDGNAPAPVVAPRSGLSRSVPLRDLVENPYNPRDSLAQHRKSRRGSENRRLSAQFTMRMTEQARAKLDEAAREQGFKDAKALAWIHR
jgi:hypothetical protein